jgi:hypothetical protein
MRIGRRVVANEAAMSFHKSLVIVVGAGASNEVGLPLGSGLMDSISTGLAFNFRGIDRGRGGSDLIMSAIEYLVYQQPGARNDFNEYLLACKTIFEAIQQALSIDNLVDALRGDDRLEICAKIAIANSILKAERESRLYTATNSSRSIDFSAVKNTWYARLWDLIAARSRPETVAERLSQIAIVTFNYDRCIEHFLHSSLQNFFRVSPQVATSLLSNLTIHHAYGQLGSLGWSMQGDAVPFGDQVEGARLVSIAKKLKTFTEGTDENESQVADIRRYLHYAERVAFLGFAYDPQNLQLLYGTSGTPTKDRRTAVYGTAYKVSEPNRRAIHSALRLLGGYGDNEIELVPDIKCEKLLADYSWALSLATVRETA